MKPTEVDKAYGQGFHDGRAPLDPLLDKLRDAYVEIERLRKIEGAALRACGFDWSGAGDDAAAAIEELRRHLAPSRKPA